MEKSEKEIRRQKETKIFGVNYAHKPLSATAIQHLLGFHNWRCIMFITPRYYITCFAVSSGTAEGFIFGGRKHTLCTHTHKQQHSSHLACHSSYLQDTNWNERIFFLLRNVYFSPNTIAIVPIMTG